MIKVIKVILLIVLIFAILSVIALSITTLFMSTGRFWKCPGETRLFSWLLGFGIDGILLSWLCIIILFERYINRNNSPRRSVITLCIVMIILLTLFSLSWGFVGVAWTSTRSFKTTSYYYINGKNVFCHSVIFYFTRVMSIALMVISSIFLGFVCVGLQQASR